MSIVEDGEIVEGDVSEINSELQPSSATAVNVEVEISRSTAVVDHQLTETSESPATEKMEASPCAGELVTSNPSVGEPKCTATDMATDEADPIMTVSAPPTSSTEEAEHSVAPENPEASAANNSSDCTTADKMAADFVWRCRDNPNPYECSVCRAKYDSRWGLSYHLEFHHNLGILSGNFVFDKGMASFVYETALEMPRSSPQLLIVRMLARGRRLPTVNSAGVSLQWRLETRLALSVNLHYTLRRRVPTNMRTGMVAILSEQVEL